MRYYDVVVRLTVSAEDERDAEALVESVLMYATNIASWSPQSILLTPLDPEQMS